MIDGVITARDSNDTYTYFMHCNWGWSGYRNGYFLSEVFNTNEEPDFPNYDVVIQLEDPQGNNLALPENSHVLEGTVLEFDGKTIPLDLNPAPRMRSAGPAIDYGFRATDYFNFGYCLVYAELSGEKEFKNEPFRIVWPDQSTDEIRLTAKSNFRGTSRKVKWQSNGKVL